VQNICTLSWTQFLLCADFLHMPSESHLDERVLEILQLLWQHGPLKPSELQSRFSRRMKNPALRWLLNDLVARGKLYRRKEGKAFTYGTVIKRRELINTLGTRLRELLFGGSALAMIGELSEVQKLNPSDIALLRKVARGKTRRGPKKEGKEE
jgi:BlaI family penicillinase repressor